MTDEQIAYAKKTISRHCEIPLDKINEETEIPDPDGFAINLHMTKKWRIETPDRSGNYFALLAKPFTLGELIKLNPQDLDKTE